MKKLICTLLLFSALFLNVSAQSYNSFYGDIVSECSYDSINNRLLDFENLGIKEPGTLALNNTLSWMIIQYQEYGYTDIVIDTFTYSSYEVYNLIVTKTGTIYPNIFYIMDGHYDTKTGTGTNDNGSGTSIILETARLMQAIPTKYSVKFIHFSMEEVGLVGSTHYVNDIAFPNGMDIKILLNIDEVGGVNGMTNNTIVCERDGTTPTAANEDSWAFTDTLATCVGLYSNLSTTISYAYASDYMPFKAKGYAITGLFEDNYSPHAHTASDSIGNLDIPYVFEIAKASVGASLYFAVAYEPTGIEEENDSHFIVYPNPSEDVINIKTKYGAKQPNSYQLINYLGEIVTQGQIASTNHTISVESFSSGIYFLQIESEEKVSSKKVLITK